MNFVTVSVWTKVQNKNRKMSGLRCLVEIYAFFCSVFRFFPLGKRNSVSLLVVKVPQHSIALIEVELFSYTVFIAFVKERFHNAVEIDILGIFEGYSSLQIWPPQKTFQGRNYSGRMT